MEIRSSFIIFVLLFVLQHVQATGPFCKRRGDRLVVINPPTLFDPTEFGFAQIVVDTNTAIAHVTGQNAINQTGALVGDTLAKQLEQTFHNIELALQAVDAEVSDIVKAILIFVDLDPRTALELLTANGMTDNLAPPSVIFSTDTLVLEGALVEIQVDAAVPKSFIRRLVCG